MKRVLTILFASLLLAAFAGTLVFLYKKSQTPPVVYEVEKPFIADVIKKTVANGAIVPRHEVAIKPQVSGILRKIYVEPGQEIKQGDLIAEIKIIPDVVRLNEAESAVAAAKIAAKNANKELERHRQLYKQAILSEFELRQYELERDLRVQELKGAQSNLQLVREGATRKGGDKVSNQVRATVAGTVLEVPVEEGASVIESNTFNEGTTIATIADMSDMIFLGTVDESEIAQLKTGMEIEITIGALDDQKFIGNLEYIAPKGVEAEGTIEFEIKAALKLKEGVFIRAGYSANADIVLDERKQVLVIRESLLQFEDSQPFVEIETAEQQFERQAIKLGLSDGINVEVVSGVDQESNIKRPSKAS